MQLRRGVWQLVALLAVWAGLGGLAVAQTSTPNGANSGSRPERGPGADFPAAADPMARADEERLSLRRITERQKAIVADTTKLLQLAQELKDEVDKSNKDQLSIAVVKKAEEVEKLAKSVKEKMKGF